MTGLLTSIGLTAAVAAALYLSGRRRSTRPTAPEAPPVTVTVDDLFRLIGMKEAELAALRVQLAASQQATADLLAERDTLRAALESLGDKSGAPAGG